MRVVSLCPSITETLVAIGGLPSLAAVTRYCTRPKGLLWSVPRIGGTKTPDVARILDLKPDVVFANAEENRQEDVEALRAAGVDVDVTLPRRVAEVPSAIRKWGERLGTAGEADALAVRIESRLEEIASEPAPAPFRYAYWIWKDPWMTVSDDTYVADLIRLAGGINVFGDETVRYPTAVPADALARRADVQVFPSEPYPFSEERHGAAIARAFGPGIRKAFVDGDDYCWHGARTLDGIKAVRTLMNSGIQA
ncbi:MAG TPA: helical backbone metal receptor [Thermoanaerobaculia bacterium]|jgi:ABC-type Fe3+-hydroxamate transport system substrate-binding protein|nr:helical backbone metal receptor [Thermoanaerobaculia bacterium]